MFRDYREMQLEIERLRARVSELEAAAQALVNIETHKAEVENRTPAVYLAKYPATVLTGDTTPVKNPFEEADGPDPGMFGKRRR